MPLLERGRIRCAILTGTCLLSAWWVEPASARPSEPVLIQVTRNTEGDIWQPRLRTEAASSVVFVSDGDVLGTGTAPGHREVYFYDTLTGVTTRVTNTVEGESYEASRETDSKHSGRATFVTFTSTADLDPDVGNADGNPEIFAWVRETGEYVQLTDTVAPVVNGEPYASDGGKCIVFRSNADLEDNDNSNSGSPSAGFSNADGSDEIFRMDFLDNEFGARVTTQVSNGPAGTRSEAPAVGGFWFTRQCRSASFQSDHDQMGNGSEGLHIYNFTKTSGVLEQLSPPGVGINIYPDISGASNFARGPFVMFASNMNPIGNDNEGFEIFRFRLFKDELLQYTVGAGDSLQPSVSDGGGWAAISSSSDMIDRHRRVTSSGTPEFNPDGNLEIYRFERKRRIAQITQSQGCENTDPSVRDTARSIAFRSTCDLILGLNPSGTPQVFLYLNVKPNDPLLTAGVCKVEDGCCNVANGCYKELSGSKIRPDKAGIRPDWK